MPYPDRFTVLSAAAAAAPDTIVAWSSMACPYLSRAGRARPAVIVVVFEQSSGAPTRQGDIFRDSRTPGAVMMQIPSHELVVARDLPQPIGPYSPAVTLERLVFVSGQGATDPKTGKLAGADVATQTEQVFRNLASILNAAGSDLSRVLRCGVFLVDLRDFDAMNAVYARAFGNHRPARTTVQVASLPDPGLRVEIDAIAYRPGEGE